MKTSAKYVKIFAPSRIHVSLVCMGDNEFRSNGGAGFAINGFDVVITSRLSSELCLVLSDELDLNEPLKNKILDLEAYLAKLCKNKSLEPVKICVDQIPPRNCGFGTGTSLELSCIESIFILNSIDYTASDIIYASSRGGTSGIGVHSYFEGGFIVDLGHRPKKMFLPSSHGRKDQEVPLRLGRWNFPPWDIGIFLPDEKPLRNEKFDENDFFERFCNLSFSDISEIGFIVTYGLISSVMEEDLVNFGRAINFIQKTKWKKLEVGLYGGEVDSIREMILEKGALACGMSSIGPLLYFFSETPIDKVVASLSPSARIVQPNNTGRKVVTC
ncbi:beta-ribofuranosylaminobenzene 5'-phosphate synthase family protein [Marinobacter sp.]|uniref:beta-ribofuranosylaminobenzene 5'-phosphate synthase family protein n=1 Tax=Marinobacter sp. TaxID=50741 RepID=UPI00356542B6